MLGSECVLLLCKDVGGDNSMTMSGACTTGERASNSQTCLRV